MGWSGGWRLAPGTGDWGSARGQRLGAAVGEFAAEAAQAVTDAGFVCPARAALPPVGGDVHGGDDVAGSPLGRPAVLAPAGAYVDALDLGHGASTSAPSFAAFAASASIAFSTLSA